MKKVPEFLRWFVIPLVLVGVVGLYLSLPVRGQGNPSRPGPRRVDVAESNIHAASATGSSNPIAFGTPVVIPESHPTTITILQNQAFGNAPPPAQSTVKLPAGHWKSVILTITGTQQGRQFDRLMLMWVANTQIFSGVTPEPTQAGIAWKLQKDVTAYLPLLTGQQTFTTWINNFVTSVYTGIPVVSVTLSFYTPVSQNEALDAESATKMASTIVPLSTTPNMTTVHPNNALTATLNLPTDISRAYLDLYAIAQIGDEFWWGQTPAFRELEVTIDGKPAGVVWPYPTVYTGGVNPYLWRPITGINTMNMPSYRVNLTPFTGLLNGQHTISISVFNSHDYWLLDGSLFLSEDQGHPTSGSIVTNTLTFPTQAQSTTTNLIGSTNPSTNKQIDTTATRQYQITGNIQTSHGLVTSTVTSSLDFSNSEIYVNPDNWEMIHGLQDVKTDETLTDFRGTSRHHVEETYTFDSASASVQQSNNQNNSLLTGNQGQSLNIITDTSGSSMPAYHSVLDLNLEGQANLQRADTTVASGSTTAYAHFDDSEGFHYRRLLEARNGTVTLDQLASNLGN